MKSLHRTTFMTECKIKKYDELPGRIGWLDIDYMRFKLLDNTEKIKYLESENKAIREKLDMIIKQQNKNNGKN